jgi:hypothetical protein
MLPRSGKVAGVGLSSLLESIDHVVKGIQVKALFSKLLNKGKLPFLYLLNAL